MIIPAVLVIADQLTLGIGGVGGLAGAGEAEEDGHVPIPPTLAEQCMGGEAAQGRK